MDFTQMLIDDLRSHGGQVTTGPMAGRPLMILTTKGAKTGEDRVAVVAYTRDGDRYVIAASKSGAPTNPDWFHNLQANPEVGVEAGGEGSRRTRRSRAATSGIGSGSSTPMSVPNSASIPRSPTGSSR